MKKMGNEKAAKAIVARIAALLITLAMLITSMPFGLLSYANEADDTQAATEQSADTETQDKTEPADKAAETPKEEAKEEPKKEAPEKDSDKTDEKETKEATKLSAESNGVAVNLSADAGVFPEGATLSVNTVSKTEQKKVDAAIDAEKKDEQKVAASYTFDIKVLDANDKEVQPADGKSVNLSFTTDEVADDNLSTRVFHVDEEKNELNATELSVSTDGNTATVETDGFSYYTVEFTYGDKQFVLEGDGVVKLDDLLKSIGIEGEVKGTKVSNRELFDVIRGTKDGVKYITTFADGKTMKVPTNNPDGKVRYVVSYKPFQTEEWMDVAMADGATYHIIVTDAIVNNGTETDNIPGVAQGIYPNHTQNIPLGDIWIDDDVLNDTPDCRNRAVFEKGDLMTEKDPETGKLKYPGFIIYNTNSDTGTGHSCYGGNTGAHYFVEFDTHEQTLSGEVQTTVTATGKTVYQSYNYFEGVIGTYKWEDAAVRLGEDGKEEKLDVFVEYSNPLITFQNRNPDQHVTEIKDRYLGLFSGNMITIGQTADSGAADLRYGLVMDIKPYVKDKKGNIVSGNFYYPMTDLDVLRTPYNNFRTFYQADDRNENYDETTNRYSETVFIDHNGVFTNSRGESLFIPGAEGDARNYMSRITNTNSEYVVYPGTNGGDSTPSQYTGFTLLAKNDEFAIKFMGSSAGLNQAGMENYVLSGQDFNHKIRHSTSPEEGGTIQTTYEGNHSGELDDDSGVIEPNIMASSSGQTVVYTFKPKPGYSITGVYVNSGKGCTDWEKTDGDWSKIPDEYPDKKIKEGDGTDGTYQAHDDDGDGEIDRYTYTFTGINSDNAIHVAWQKTRLTISKRVTGNGVVDDTFTFRIRAWNTEDETQFVDFAKDDPDFTHAENNWYTFTLGNFESKDIGETVIPVGYKWEVEEADSGTAGGWTCIDPDDGKRSGEISQLNQAHQANFLNKRTKNTPQNKRIFVKKVWEGDTEDLRPKRLTMHAHTDDGNITIDESYHDVQEDGSWLYEIDVPDGAEDKTWEIYEDLPDEYRVYYEGTEGIGVIDNPVTGIKTGQDPVVLTNKRINRTLTIGKALTEKLENAESFEFTVKFWTGAAKYKNPYNIDPIPARVEKVKDGTFKFTLTTDGSSDVEQVFTDLPYGLKYEVTEKVPTGWKQIASPNSSGVVNENKTAAFLNSKNQNGIVLKLWEDHDNRFDTRPVGQPEAVMLTLTIKNYEWVQDEDSIIDVTGGTTFEALDAAYNDPGAKDLTKLEKNIVDANGQRVMLTAPKKIKYGDNEDEYICDKRAATRYVAFKVDENHSERDAYSTDDDVIFSEDDELDGWYYEFPMKDSERVESAVEDGSEIPYYVMSDIEETSKGLVFKITNTLKENKLKVVKEVTDPEEDESTEFNFAVKFWSEVDQDTHHPVKFMHSHFVTTKDAQGQDVQEFEYLFERGVMLGDKNVEGIHEKIGDEIISRPNSGNDSDKIDMEEGDLITEALRGFTIDVSDKVTDQPWSATVTMYDTGLTLADLGLTYGGLDSFKVLVEQSPDVVNDKFNNGRRIDYFLVPTGAPPFSVRTPYTGLDEAYEPYGSNGTYHFKLKNGADMIFDPLPAGVFYEIVEYKDPDWKLVESINEKGRVLEDLVTATFKNEKKKSQIKIVKKTKYDEAGTFKFRAKIWEGEGADIKYMDLSKQGATPVSDEPGVYEFTLENNGEKTIKDIYFGYKYEVWEELESGWELLSINGDTEKTKAEGEADTEQLRTYTFLNKGPGVPPKAKDDETYGLKGKKQKGKPQFEQGTAPFTKFKLIDPETGKEVDELTVPGVGKYTVDPETGEVTFEPEPGFVGDATKVTVRATDEYGNTADGHYTPHVVDPTESLDVSRTIHFTYEKKNGKKVKSNLTQTVTITRKALEVDPKTGKVTKWGPWSSATFPAVKNPDKEAGSEWVTKDIAPALTINGPEEIPDVYIVYHKVKGSGSSGSSGSSGNSGGSNGAKTGDNNNIAIWICLLAAAIAVAIGISRRRRRDSE